MHYKATLILFLQALTLCLGQEVITVIDTSAQLELQGSSFTDSYIEAAGDLSSPFPQPIIDSGSTGIWYFKNSATANGGIFTFATPNTINRLSLKVYATEKVFVSFQDKAQDETEVSVTLSQTAGDNWYEFVIEAERNFTSPEPLTIRFFFPPTETPGHLLVDNITIVGERREDAGTTPPTNPESTTVDDGDDTTASSAALVPGFVALTSALLIRAIF